MKKIYKEYKDILLSILKSKYFIITIIIFLIAGFGFTLFNPAIGIDDTSFDRYYYGGEMLAQGRFLFVIVGMFFKNIIFEPVFNNLMYLVLTTCSALIYCALYKKISLKKISNKSLLLFCLIFLTYPLIAEIYIYDTINIVLGLGYLLSALITLLLYEFYLSNFKNKIIIIITLILMILLISSYESFIMVVLCGFLSTIFLSYKYDDQMVSKKVSRYILIVAGTIILGIVIELLLTNTYLNFANIKKSIYPATNIYWDNNYPFLLNFERFKDSMEIIFIKNPFNLLGIRLFKILSVIFWAYAIFKSAKTRNQNFVYLAILMIVSNFALSVLQGIASPYRVMQSIALFAGFICMFIYEDSHIKIKPIIFILVMYLAIIQSRDINRWLHNDYKRYQEDKNYMISVSQKLMNNYDINKPIIFLGYYKTSDSIMKSQTNGNSFINWGVYAFGEPGTELFKFLEMHGYYFNRPTIEQKEEAQKEFETIKMSLFPKENSIIEKENYIIVNLTNK